MKNFLIILLGLTATSLFASDDVADTEPTLSTPPTPMVTVMPRINRTLTDSPGEVQVLVILNHYGYVTGAKVVKSTNPLLNDPCLEAIRQWRYKPAQHNGVAVTASFVQPFTFGNDTYDIATGITARPKTRRQVAPIVPDALKYVSCLVTIALELDNQGKITGIEVISSSHEEFNPATITAVRQWEFSPAYVNGKAVPSTVYVPFEFVGQTPPEERSPPPIPVDNSELRPLRQASPKVPEELAELSGTAEIEFIIDAKGYVSDAKILTATQPELGELARSTVLNWKFTPIVKNGTAVAVKAVQPFRFGQGTVAIAQIDRLPEVRHRVSPELPASLQGASGYANALFEIDARGQVTSVEIKEASHEDFKAAVLFAAKQWTFKPALRAGEPTSARVAIPFLFGKK